MAGRPSLTGRKEETPVLTVRVSPEVRDALVQAAESEGRSVSEIVRDGVEMYLSHGYGMTFD